MVSCSLGNPPEQFLCPLLNPGQVETPADHVAQEVQQRAGVALHAAQFGLQIAHALVDVVNGLVFGGFPRPNLVELLLQFGPDLLGLSPGVLAALAVEGK